LTALQSGIANGTIAALEEGIDVGDVATIGSEGVVVAVEEQGRSG